MKNLIIEPGSHQARLQALLAATSGPVRIASPYVTAVSLFSESRARDLLLLTDISGLSVVMGGISLDALATLMELGAECRDLADSEEPRLHAKVYVFGSDRAVITSANFTASGLGVNTEVGVELEGDEVPGLISWFDERWDRATTLTSSHLNELRRKTEPLRNRFKFLRDCSTLLDKPRTNARTATAIRAALDGHPIRYFLCNTDRKHDLDDETRMMDRNYAAAWEIFAHTRTMDEVSVGDLIFMYANGNGVIRVGKALGPCERAEPGRSDRISKGTSVEWRVPVLWLTPISTDKPAPWPGVLPPTFQDVSEQKWRRQRNAVLRHFSLSGR